VDIARSFNIKMHLLLVAGLISLLGLLLVVLVLLRPRRLRQGLFQDLENLLILDLLVRLDLGEVWGGRSCKLRDTILGNS
jgi:hypothetical protein